MEERKVMAQKRTWIMGEAFAKRMPHHQGMKELWETKWKFPVSIYWESMTGPVGQARRGWKC